MKPSFIQNQNASRKEGLMGPVVSVFVNLLAGNTGSGTEVHHAEETPIALHKSRESDLYGCGPQVKALFRPATS
jgi:hypothetical protein